MEASVAVKAERMLDSWVSLSASYADTVSRIGARLVVLCKFADAVLPQLTAVQCKQIDSLFRQGIEDALSRTDDIKVSGGYHAALLEQTNVLLAALEMRGGK
jgi:hypothetical protein